MTLLVGVGCADVRDDELSGAQEPASEEPQLMAAPSEATSEAVSPDAVTAPAVGAREKGFNEPFTVMSLNVRIPDDSGERAWSVRKGLLNSMVRRFGAGEGPEVIGLQEFRANTFNELTALMPQYWWYRVDRGDGEMLSIFVRTSRFDVLDFSYRNTTNSQRDDLCTVRDDEDPNNRPIMYVHLRDRLTGRQSYVYNTHYPSRNSCERKQMSKIVADYIASRGAPADDVVMVGDFNDGVNGDGSRNDSYQRLLNYTGLRNAYADIRVMNSSNEFTSLTDDWQKTLRRNRLIDHVLVSGRIGVRDAWVDKTMFDAWGNPFDCTNIINGTCNNSGISPNSLRLYSDHWASWALLFQ